MKLMNNRINHTMNRSIIRNAAIALSAVVTIILLSAGFGSNLVGTSGKAKADGSFPALDIVATNNVGPAPGAITFLRGNGDGTFGPPPILPAPATTTTPALNGPVGIDGGDFNNDGKRDVVVANYGNSTSTF